MRVTSARFVASAYRPEEEPKGGGPVALFAGRSNVGKSALINALTGKPGLARTSSTPGRTRSLNFYRVNESVWFVDLPGYGYAKVPQEVRRTWQPMVEGFLKGRKRAIALAVVVVDARLSPSDLDLWMRDWLVQQGIDHVVAATKADKLSANTLAASRRRLEEGFEVPRGAGGALLMVSSRTGMGIRELWARLDEGMTRHAGRR